MRHKVDLCKYNGNNYRYSIFYLQDSNPAGTIFAEDIVDVAPDHEESKKDSKVILQIKLQELLSCMCSTRTLYVDYTYS